MISSDTALQVGHHGARKLITTEYHALSATSSVCVLYAIYGDRAISHCMVGLDISTVDVVGSDAFCAV